MNLPNGKSQTNRDQKSNLLFLQQHNIEEVDSNLIEKLINKLIDLIDKLVCESWETQNHTKTLIFTILDTLQLNKLVIVKIFTV